MILDFLNRIHSLIFFRKAGCYLNEISAKSVFVEVFDPIKNTSRIVYSKDEKLKFYPASVVKLFTLYFIFYHEINLSIEVEVKPNDVRPGSGNNLKSGDLITVENLLKNMFFASSNSSAKILKDLLEVKLNKSFVEIANEVIFKLNLKNTAIKNEHGLFNKEQKVTAQDLIVLVENLILIPKAVAFFKQNVRGSQVFLKRDDVNTLIYKHVQKDDFVIKTGSLFPNVFNSLCFIETDGLWMISSLGYSKSFADRVEDIQRIKNLVETK